MPDLIKQVQFKPGLPLEIEVLPIAATISRHNAAMRTPHRANFYNIFWVQKGKASYFIDFKPVEVQENSFLFISKDRVKTLNTESDHDGKILLFTESFFARSEEDIRYLHGNILFNDLFELPILDIASFPSLQTIFNEIETELTKENDPYQADIAHGLLRSLLFLAARERMKHGFKEITKGADFDYLVLFQDLLETHFKSLKIVGGYAALMNVAEKRLTTATAKAAGKSPKSIIDERVVLEAKRLLVHSNSSIKVIGYDLGFEDPAYFIRYFRKHTQQTPVEFRESFLPALGSDKYHT